MSTVFTRLMSLLVLFVCTQVQAQTYGPQCPPDIIKDIIKFTGKAPAPWAIDGSTTDWESIIGSYTGNPMQPYTPSVTPSLNWSADGMCTPSFPSDRDHPEPANNLRFLANTFDDYNLYFYLRRVDNTGGVKSFFFFLDINVDGFLSEGEPVISGSFNNSVVANFSLGYYLPNTATDYVAGKGNYIASPLTHMVDGYTIVGSVKPVFNARKISGTAALGANEVFTAAVTEDGSGVEWAVPWRFLKNYVTNTTPLNSSSVLLYHAALQTGGGEYEPANVKDNAGCCSGHAGTVSITTYSVQHAQLTTLVVGSSYRMSFELVNLTNITTELRVFRLHLENIQTATGGPIDKTQIQVRAAVDKNCNGVIDNTDPVVSLAHTGPPGFDYYVPTAFLGAVTPSQEKVCIVAEVTFPAGVPVSSFTAEFSTDVRSEIIEGLACVPVECVDGGRPINPASFSGIFDLTKKTREATNESLYNQLLVYPNPSKGTANLSLPTNTGLVDITVMDYTGKLLRHYKNVSAQSMQLSSLGSGVYSILITNKQTGIPTVKKLVVQK